MSDEKPAELRSACEGGTQQFYQIEEGWMETYSGKRFTFMNPRPEMIDVEDIAHAIGKLCRYGGHSRRFYSVAEHCVHLAKWVIRQGGDTQTALTALMHDATEGYLVDMPRPIKHQLPDYRRIEDVLAEAIAAKFGLTFPMPRLIHEADSRILVDERAQVMSKSGNDWGVDGLQAPSITIGFWSPEEAPRRFLTAFRSLTSRRDAGMPPDAGEF